MPNLTHLTTVHPRDDVRIFHKECTSLAKHPDWHVSLIVADGQGDAVAGNVHIHDVGKSAGRLNRMISATRRALAKAAALDADLYHLHDPELIPVGLDLLRRKKIVIFDAHEDVPQQVLNKPYLNPVLAKIVSKSFASFESWALKRFDGIVAATPGIADKFRAINPNVLDINNYPLLDEFAGAIPRPQARDNPYVCYIGGLSKIRGIHEIVQSTASLKNPVRLHLAGRFSEADFERQIKALPAWSNVEYLGFLNRDGVREALAYAIAGLVTLHPIPNYFDALPVKMFEYMAAGLPVVASNFPLWREIIESAQCGLCVDPLDPEAIAQAIDYLYEHPDEAREMGENGCCAVLEQYNWAIEEQKLVAFYQKLLQGGR